MESFAKTIEGKKTYAVAAAFAVSQFALAMGWIDSATADHIQKSLIALGLVTLRSAVTPTKNYTVPDSGIDLKTLVMGLVAFLGIGGEAVQHMPPRDNTKPIEEPVDKPQTKTREFRA